MHVRAFAQPDHCSSQPCHSPLSLTILWSARLFWLLVAIPVATTRVDLSMRTLAVLLERLQTKEYNIRISSTEPLMFISCCCQAPLAPSTRSPNTSLLCALGRGCDQAEGCKWFTNGSEDSPHGLAANAIQKAAQKHHNKAKGSKRPLLRHWPENCMAANDCGMFCR